ncbi:fimbrial biogenesis usher protein [Erwinia sp. E602]|uniref:fimbrial biogenesis usher protein n=1 Tax=Erwinia sp. E602 TaxID=2675378 RepID=UPI001BA993CB|nr:fimbrial biogenesis usher protein [Erwinia sp. E602]
MQQLFQKNNRRAAGREVTAYRSLSVVALLVGLALLPADAGAELYFAPQLISSDPAMVADITRLQQSGAQLAGPYQVDLFINGRQAGNRTVLFNEAAAGTAQQEVHDSTGLMACLTRSDLEELGVDVRQIPASPDETPHACLSPGKFIAGAFTAFDFEHQRLDVSVPQAAMRNSARGYISPERWDEGINAALLNYSYSGSNSRGRYGDSRSSYLNLNGGVNIGPWRIRDYRTWNEYRSDRYSWRRWQHLNTYAQRAIIPLRSNFTAGDGSSDGDVFDSLNFRGVQLATDDSMYPDSQRGFAPVIRGVASTNAKVSIRQNGYTVYQTFVSPGAFAIDDLFPVYSSGDLEVTVTEADGSVRSLTVPYSSVPVLQREGRTKYSLTTGRYRASGDNYRQPGFIQGTLIHGFPHNITGYGGIQYAGNYLAGLLGMGLNLGTLGAVSVDITQASSTLADGSHHRGQSLRFLYARSLNTLGTTFQLTGYRYSTEGFHTLDETALKGMEGWRYDTDTVDADGRPTKRPYTDYYNLYNTKRAKVQASVSQRVANLGSLYLSGVRQSYWNTRGYSDSLQAGFNGMAGRINYGLTWSYSRQSGQPAADKSVFLSLSMPLDTLFGGGSENARSMYATYSASRNQEGEISHQAGISGTALEGGNLSWSASQGLTRREGDSGSLNASYRGGYGSSNLGYSYSSSYRQTSYGFSGGALLHADGLTLGQQLGETSVLIAAPGAAGARIENETGVRTDWRGYTLKPYASVYRENRVALDIATLGDNTDVDSAVTQVVPTRGAVVRAGFKGYTGSRVLMTLTRAGRPLPFGTMVTAGERAGIVGDDGQVYLSGMPEKGSVRAVWGAAADQQCSFSYRLPAEKTTAPVIRISAACRP